MILIPPNTSLIQWISCPKKILELVNARALPKHTSLEGEEHHPQPLWLPGCAAQDLDRANLLSGARVTLQGPVVHIEGNSGEKPLLFEVPNGEAVYRIAFPIYKPDIFGAKRQRSY